MICGFRHVSLPEAPVSREAAGQRGFCLSEGCQVKWFRFYHEALDDPKVQRLSGPLFKGWINLLCLASRQESRGNLPPTPQISFGLRISEERTLFLLEELAARGLLDRDEDLFCIHNWDARQFESDDVTARTQRFRERSRNVAENPPRTEEIQNRQRNRSEQSRRRSTTAPDENFLARRYESQKEQPCQERRGRNRVCGDSF